MRTSLLCKLAILARLQHAQLYCAFCIALQAHHFQAHGRLDKDSEGLLLFTNDGDLINRLTHPRNEIPKTYLVKIEGTIPEAALAKLRAGVELDGKMTNRSTVRVSDVDDKYTKLYVTITEGRNRQVRRMFESVGKEVVFLKRIKIGDLSLSGIDRGKCRPLSRAEVEYLRNL